MNVLSLILLLLIPFYAEAGGSVSAPKNGCVVFNKSNWSGNYYKAAASDTTSKTQITNGGKCGAYNDWVSSRRWYGANINVTTVSACKKGVSSWKCGKNGTVKICDKAEERTRSNGQKYWTHTECTVYGGGGKGVKGKHKGRGLYFIISKV